MNAIFFHLAGHNPKIIRRGFEKENIALKSRVWNERALLDPILQEASLIILPGSGRGMPLLARIPLIKKSHPAKIIAVMDEGNDSEKTQKIARDNGADAYFVKPFNFPVIAMRLKNILFKNQHQRMQRWIHAFGVWLDLERRFARRKKHLIPLRNKEFSLLELFILNRGKLLTRTAIQDYVWDRNANFLSNTVDVHINRLRRKLDDPFGQKLIHTVHCLGYIFERRRGHGPKRRLV